ncbi:unnamed protein product [Clonostachys rosea f. rosea IK726]|uniref:Methyltransferase domain-containing protein n=2 Tax=Bionectria ochroleuca TaxID=29856 RepID=A0A0B7KHK2_BIOOC|nr:unnamed protein product [Clonostachys rosea f. rosea IK726]
MASPVSAPDDDQDMPQHSVVRISSSSESSTPDLRSRDVQWFHKSPGQLSPAFRALLEEYGRVAPECVEQHLISVRNLAWEVNPMPCLGRFLFTELHMAHDEELHKTVLRRLQSGDRLIDVGCCLGQDIRKLIHDGAPAENLVGLDLDERFFEAGFQLFKDSDTKARFVKANILRQSPALDEMNQSFDMAYMDMFLHMLSWDDQITACKTIVSLLKPVQGSFFAGESAGHVHGIPTQATWNKLTFRHNEASFKKLMQQVSEETGSKWDVKSQLVQGSGRTSWANQMNRRFLFQVTRL